ncbi:hypothetical protein Tco_0217731 [Tanacetum coccineum]
MLAIPSPFPKQSWLELVDLCLDPVLSNLEGWLADGEGRVVAIAVLIVVGKSGVLVVDKRTDNLIVIRAVQRAVVVSCWTFTLSDGVISCGRTSKEAILSFSLNPLFDLDEEMLSNKVGSKLLMRFIESDDVDSVDTILLFSPSPEVSNVLCDLSTFAEIQLDELDCPDCEALSFVIHKIDVMEQVKDNVFDIHSANIEVGVQLRPSLLYRDWCVRGISLGRKEVDINKKTENQAKMTKLSMEWKRLCKIKAKVQKCQSQSQYRRISSQTGAGTEEYYWMQS